MRSPNYCVGKEKKIVAFASAKIGWKINVGTDMVGLFSISKSAGKYDAFSVLHFAQLVRSHNASAVAKLSK